jgi:hypothetical protein
MSDVDPPVAAPVLPADEDEGVPGALQPPYPLIARALAAGRVIPFLGAGASLVGRVGGAAFNPRAPDFLPTGAELAAYLAAEAAFPQDEDQGDLAKVCSYFADVISDRDTLRRVLRELLNRDFKPGPLHHLLAAVDKPLMIVSTNYDTLIEQAFRERGKPYDLVVYPAEVQSFVGALWWPHGAAEPQKVASNELEIDLSTTTVIFKMHGTISPVEQWDNFVITEEDYIEFLSRMTTNSAIPSTFYTHFRGRSFLFLGYSLRDWNLRVLLKNLNKTFEQKAAEVRTTRSWAIQRKPSMLERALWERKGVQILNVDLERFVARLRDQMGL